MKKVVCVQGSPRKDGNCATICSRFLETAEGMGARTQVFRLYGLNFKGCIACMACKTGSEECVIKDDLAPVLAAVKEADVLVAASPVYFGHVTGEMKCFIDRTFSFLAPDFLTNPNASRLAPGKKLVFVLAQGQSSEKEHKDVYDMYGKYFNMLFGYECHVIRGLGLHEKTDAAGDAAVIGQTEELAREMLAH